MIQEINYLDKRKSDRLIQNCSNLKHKTIMLIMLDCGLRVSECISLQYKNFDFKQRLLTVKSLKKRGEERMRTIPVSSRLYECLADYVKTQANVVADAFLFPSQEGHITRKAVNAFMTRYKAKHPEFSKLHPHALRHTFATHHLAAGTELHNIKTMLGHKRYDTTLIYAHTPIEILRKNVDLTTAEKISFFDRLKLSVFPKPAATIINMTRETGNFTIGRQAEMLKVADLINKNCNVILTGGIGVGKSHLIQQIKPNIKTLHFDDCNDIKKTLIQTLIYLYKGDKKLVFELMYGEFDDTRLQVKLSRESTSFLCNEIIKVTKKHEYLLVIDNVDRITPRSVKALEMLKDHFTILTSAREIPINKQSFLWNFEIIRLEPLPRTHALELVHKLSYDMDIEDFELYRNHVWEQSNGNPRVIFELTERYRKEVLITNDVIRTIRHTGSLREIDMTMVVLVLLGGMAILRYLSRETGNDSLRFIGGCAMILLIISRYFFGFTKRKWV